MPVAKLTEAEFIAAWARYGSAGRVADATGIGERAVLRRRQRLQKRGVIVPTSPTPGYESLSPYYDARWTFPPHVDLWINQGPVVIFSDCHFWPGEVSKAFVALLAVIRQVKPRAIIANGDVFDGGSIGRHDPFGWSQRPSVKQEMDECIARLSDVEQAAPKGCRLLLNIGNHDQRFERNLVSKVPEYAGFGFTRLADHFPAWELQWATRINWDSPHPVMVKHRYAGGVHAGYSNSLRGGVTMVTGHTHLLEVKPIGDYRGRRWGIQTGTLADHDGPQFEYTEQAPSSACSGFAVLTFFDDRLKPPELCEVIDGNAWFRGEIVA